MPNHLDYRRRLLSIVTAFQDPTAADHVRARRLVERLYHDPRRRLQTLDDLVWGGFVSELTDSVFYELPEYLQATREVLLHGSTELHRAYLSFDFRSDFTEVEHNWHAQLLDLAVWLQRGVFDNAGASQAEYERRVETISALSHLTPPPPHVGEETLYHYILRTAEAVLTGIESRSFGQIPYLVAAAPWVQVYWNPDNANDRPWPDATASVSWAERALRSIIRQEWVWVTWQITNAAYLISIH
ncbi:MAG: hypothetical protein OJF49_001710 [Ktedonobacterales bacterium]|jgi:hypothetical protein|nr:MAG: hypothetical protein OJF49_001710 [Ktedonobacterales bacterium]